MLLSLRIEHLRSRSYPGKMRSGQIQQCQSSFCSVANNLKHNFTLVKVKYPKYLQSSKIRLLFLYKPIQGGVDKSTNLVFTGQITDKHYEDYLKSLRHKSFVAIIKKCKDARYLRLTVPNVIRSGVTSSTHNSEPQSKRFYPGLGHGSSNGCTAPIKTPRFAQPAVQ